MKINVNYTIEVDAFTIEAFNFRYKGEINRNTVKNFAKDYGVIAIVDVIEEYKDYLDSMGYNHKNGTLTRF